MIDSSLGALKAELRVENTAQRVENLQSVAAALGPATTVSDLLPLLREVQKTTEKEILLCLAEQYEVLTDFIGGEENLHMLIPPLDNLVSREETVVRERAVQSICALLEKCKTQEVREKLVMHHIFPLVKRLSNVDWFSSSVAAKGLVALCYRDCGSEERTEFATGLVKPREDETQMVRIAAVDSTKVYDVCGILFSHEDPLRDYVEQSAVTSSPSPFSASAALTQGQGTAGLLGVASSSSSSFSFSQLQSQEMGPTCGTADELDLGAADPPPLESAVSSSASLSSSIPSGQGEMKGKGAFFFDSFRTGRNERKGGFLLRFLQDREK
uniref:Uncharacterized protein n=1 Tax=Chromera velia CCMP2878 TaxID=1169474 RepID=A0A0K6S6H6_9ALVE|eukprot:Cvel_16050.t1-p1 / transcript=Cvel_16050.t1 / gene=Cvel_16050 / organism=Chromera_velia_CCMP2878 / gene_product=Serine/threonine-protein phosphatase 2A 65 kDa, putative / transcript_product=Serine/threonine-protein phosphatase 2A 65 kDa, putative / location=Cvel_scaffold1220:8178-12367(+) / protein_length=326 / sequence_SO=supercontig / SO=protein_coding / is_pseudo=false